MMLETLKELLSIDAPAPEVLLEEDGCLCLDWDGLSVSIHKNGHVSWACLEPTEHGTDLNRVKEVIAGLSSKGGLR